MGKTLATVGAVITGVALAATGIGALALPGLAGALTLGGVGVSTLATIGTGLSVVGGLLQGQPNVGQTAAGTQVDWQADPRGGVPYWIGRTGSAGNIVLADTCGDKHKYLFYTTVLSGGGPMAGIDAFFGNNVALGFTADAGEGQDGYYKNRMWWKPALGAPGAARTAFAATGSKDTPADHGGIPATWGANAKLSGLAHDILALEYDANVYTAGVPKPIRVGRGVLCYDPRKDSTYPGGAGSHRWADPANTAAFDAAKATWEYSENPHLHGLHWCLGRWERDPANGASTYRRTLGVGAPIAAIDVAAFVQGANVNDANGMKAGGIVYSTDSKWDVLTAILQAGASRPLKLGATISCLVQTPRVVLDTITGADFADGSATVAGTQPQRDRINSIWPSYREENQAWEIVPAGIVGVGEYVPLDGGVRSKEVTYSLVQSSNQAAVLARYDIEDARELGPITLPCKPYWMGYKPGDCIAVNEAEIGLVNQSCLILNRTQDPATLAVTLVLRTETAGKHPFALGQTTSPPPQPGLTGIDPQPVSTPAAADWGCTGGSLASADGQSLPVIMVIGACSDPNVADVLVEYRMASSPVWVDWTSLKASAAANTITGLAPATAYYVRLRYRSVRGQVGDDAHTLTLGPVTAGVLVAGSFVGQGALSKLDAANWATQITGIGKPEDYANKVVVTRSQTAPANPGVNDLWFELSASGTPVAVYAWNGSQWVKGSDITLLNTAAGILGQGALALLNQVSSAVFAAALGGGNAILDSSFYYPSKYWTGVGGAVGTVTTDQPTYSGMRALRATATAKTSTPGQYLNIGQGGSDFRTWIMPILPGQRVEGQAWVAAAAMASAGLFIQYLDVNSNVLTSTLVSSAGSALFGSGTNGLDSLCHLGGIGPAAPANAAFALLIVQGLTNGDTNFYPMVAVCKPLLRIAGPVQTELTPWAPGVDAQPGADVTAQNSSAGFAGQGALSTQNVATVGSNTTTQTGFIRDINGNVLTLADLKTVLGTAASFTGQGTLSTQNTATWGTEFDGMPQWSTDTINRPGYNQPALKADFLVYVNGGVAVSSLKPGEAGANITENRNASGIAGQGALATMGSIPYGTTYISSLPLAIQVGQGLFGNGTIGAFYIRLNGTDPFGVNYILQHMDYTGRIVAGSGLPTATSAGYGVVFNPASPMSSPNSSTISIAATTIYMPGNITLNAPSGSYGGLAADTAYLGAYNQVNNVTGINPGNDNTFLADPAKFICYGTQRTQTSGGGYSAPSYTGGGGKNGCPDPAMLVQMANASLDGPGEIVRADAVRAGEWVWTRHEETLEWGAFRVEAVELAWSDDRCSLDMGGSTPWIGSAGHRWFAERREWTEARDLRPGERLLGPGVVVGSVVDAAPGDVVKISVEGARTYLCGPTPGCLALCHNIKSLSA